MTSGMTAGRIFWTAVVILLVALMAAAGAIESQGESESMTSAPEQSAITKTVEAYHHALERQDREAALDLLAPDVMVLESGYVEMAEEYISHHLEADMEFSAATDGERKVLESVVVGEMGWVISSTTSKGDFRGHAINSAGAEIMVLQRTDSGWKIRAIHWSSRKLTD